MRSYPEGWKRETPVGTGVFCPRKGVILSLSPTITEAETVFPATTSMAVAPVNATRFTAGGCCERTRRFATVTSRAAQKKKDLVFIFFTQKTNRKLPGRMPP